VLRVAFTHLPLWRVAFTDPSPACVAFTLWRFQPLALPPLTFPTSDGAASWVLAQVRL
jgi:hypothetical protein